MSPRIFSVLLPAACLAWFPFPHASAQPSFGRGAHAPDWKGSTPVHAEPFSQDIPVQPASPNANGFLGWRGSQPWDSARISYPTLMTPAGEKQVLQIMFRKGDEGGAAPVRMAAGTWNTVPKIYTRVLFRMDPAWDNNGNTETKFFFMRGPVDGEQNHYCSPGPDARITLQKGGGTLNLPGTADAVPFGVWHDMEMILISNTPGTADGIARMWIDGKQVIDQSDVKWHAAGQKPGWSYFWMDPTFGGGLNPVPKDQFMQLAGWYTETAP